MSRFQIIMGVILLLLLGVVYLFRAQSAPSRPSHQSYQNDPYKLR